MSCWSCGAEATERSAACATCGARLRLRTKYRIVRRLGQGAMGEVFEARDEALDRRVAIKLLFGGVAQRPGKRERFLTECRAMAALDHPAIVRIHEADAENEQLYLVQGLVDGVSLASTLRDGARWPPEEAIAFAGELLAALEHAHGKGIVHRDINPNNILVVEASGARHPVIIDFGMARLADGDATQMAWGGTPGYAAPEQIVDAKSNDLRSDLYAVAAVVWTLLTGRKPYEAVLTPETARDPHALVSAYRKIADGEVALEIEAIDLPEPLAAAIVKGLAPKPADRFQSAAEMRRALRGEPSPALDAARETPEREAPAEPRSPSSAKWVAVFGALVVAGLGLWWSSRAPSEVSPKGLPKGLATAPSMAPSTAGSPVESGPERVPFVLPSGLAIDDGGTIFVADQGEHRVVAVKNGEVAPLAGSGSEGFADGPVDQARFSRPTEVAWSPRWGLVVADRGNHRVRAIANGEVTTLAGGFEAGDADGSAGEARFDGPTGVSIAPDGAIFVADSGNGTIRRIDAQGVTTVAGRAGRAAADGMLATAGFGRPQSVVAAADGTIFVWDDAVSAVRTIRDGRVETLAKLESEPGAKDREIVAARYELSSQLTLDGDGRLLLAHAPTRRIWQLRDGALVWLAGSGKTFARDGQLDRAAFAAPSGVVAHGGSIYVSDGGAAALRRIRGGQVETIVRGPAGGFAEGAPGRLFRPWALEVFPDGSVAVGDWRNLRIRRWKNGRLETIAGSGEYGDFEGSALDAQLTSPWDLAVDDEGALIVIDSLTGRILRLAGGELRSVPAAGAQWRVPEGIAAASGVLYVADTRGHRIWVVEEGRARVLAGAGEAGFVDGDASRARFDAPGAIEVGGDGRIYVADVNNHAIRMIHEGRVHTLAGTGEPGFADGEAREAQFEAPIGLAVAADDTVYVADAGNHRIRRIAGGLVTTLAGSAVAGFADGPASRAALAQPTDVALGPRDALFVVDSLNHLLRKLDNGELTTVAGELVY